MQTLQLQIEDAGIAQKILSILNVFKDDGVYVKDITETTNTSISKDEFKDDIQQAFEELKTNQGKHTNKFVNIQI